MSLNGKFSVTVLINDVDYSEFCGVDKITFGKNLDHSQVFSKLTLNIANNIGKASNISTTDLFSVSINDEKNYYRASNITRGQSNVKVQLTNIFESLKDKTFLIIDDAGETVINPILGDFVTGEVLNNPGLDTLFKMIISLAKGEYVSSLNYANIELKTFNPNTGVANDISADLFFRVDCTINENYLEWMEELEVDDLFKDLQKIFCFTIDGGAVETFVFKSLPIMKIEEDYTLSFNSFIDPDFMKINQIKKYLNPLESVSKSSYIDSSEFLQTFNKQLIVKDVIDVVDNEEDRIYHTPLYREFASTETIELPKYMNLLIDGEAQVFKPLQFEFSTPKYILKKGYYPAYLRYFSEPDISQDAETKLSFLNARGYDKVKYICTNEASETDLTEQKQPREIAWNNAGFLVSLTCNIPKMYNVARA